MKSYNLIVIGGGSAGFAAARTAVDLKNTVAIVDSGGGYGELGGLCILRGCMPSKTLIYSAEILHLAKNAATFGLDIPTPKVDMKALHERKKAIIADFADYRQKALSSGKFDLYQQSAKFLDAHTIELADGTRLHGDHFVLATGSVVDVPPVPGLADVPYWTSDDVLDLDFLPESVIVLGGGVIACELGQFLNRIGSKVIQIQRSPHILKETTPEAATVVAKAFRDEGIELITDTQIQKVAFDGQNFSVTFKSKEQEFTKTAKYLFNALGRKPNTNGFGLEKLGIDLLPSGHIKTNAFQQTTLPHIYAAGDCAGPHEIVHIAILQGECAAKHANKCSVDPLGYDHLMHIIFTDPQVATVGLTEEKLKNRGIDYISADFPFDDHGKSILMEAKYGFVKIWAERQSGRLLGAECVGKDASELIHSLAVGITLGHTAKDLLKVQWYHPTLSEIWTYPLEDLANGVDSTVFKNDTKVNR